MEEGKSFFHKLFKGQGELGKEKTDVPADPKMTGDAGIVGQPTPPEKAREAVEEADGIVGDSGRALEEAYDDVERKGKEKKSDD